MGGRARQRPLLTVAGAGTTPGQAQRISAGSAATARTQNNSSGLSCSNPFTFTQPSRSAATRAQPRPVAAAERHGHSGPRATLELLCQLPCRRSSEGPSDLFRRGWPSQLPYGGSTRFYGGSTRWQGHRGRFTGLRLRCGDFRATAGGCHHACPMMGRRGADAPSGPGLQLGSG